MIKVSIERKILKLKKLKSRLTGATFGTKKLFKAQYTKEEYINDHSKWLDDFRNARYSSMQISGRKDAKFGNFVFTYDWQNQLLEIGLPKGKVVIQSLSFPYGQEHVDNALINRGVLKKPVAWEIADKGDYYIFKTVVHIPPNKNINYSKEDGLIGVDINYDHLAIVEIDRFGNILDKKTLHFNLAGKATGQSVKIIENAAAQLIDIANNKNKPIVLEDLNTTDSKSKLAYGSKKHWSYITRMLKDVKPQALYQELGNMENVSSLKDLRNRLELTGEGDLIPFSA